MKLVDRYRVIRWSLLTTARRLANRWWDLVGYAAGFCMASTWREADKTYGRGMRHWRCGYLRKAHRADGVHRCGDYLWSDRDAPHLRLSTRTGVDMVGAGELPRWLRGRHYTVGTRRCDRQAVRAAFDRIRSGMRDAAAKLEASGVHIGGVPFMGAGLVQLGQGYRVDATGRVVPKSPEALRSWASRVAPESDRHDVHVHRGREFLFGATIDNPGTLREEAAELSDETLGALAADVRQHPERYNVEAYEVMPDGTRVPIVHDRPPAKLQHAFTPGQAGTHLEVYCQANADDTDPGPVPGAPRGPRCGWPESRHVSRAEAKRIERQEVDDIVSSIWGDDKDSEGPQ